MLVKVPIVFPVIFLVGEAEEFSIPVTIPEEEDNPVIVFVLVLLVNVPMGCALTRPITAPPAPEEVKFVMVFVLTFSIVALPIFPILKPVIAPVVVIFEMVFVETEDTAPPK